MRFRTRVKVKGGQSFPRLKLRGCSSRREPEATQVVFSVISHINMVRCLSNWPPSLENRRLRFQTRRVSRTHQPILCVSRLEVAIVELVVTICGAAGLKEFVCTEKTTFPCVGKSQHTHAWGGRQRGSTMEHPQSLETGYSAKHLFTRLSEEHLVEAQQDRAQ